MEQLERPTMSKKLPILVTPRGTAAYAWLAKKDTKFDQEGVFKVTVVLDKKDMSEGRVNFGKDVLPGREWVKHVLELCKQHGVASKPGADGCPVKDGDKMTDAEGAPKEEFAGKLLMTFKTGYAQDLIDTKG